MRFVKESFISASQTRVFAFHELHDAVDRLIPPWETAEIIQRADISEVGSRAVIDTKLFGLFTVRWIAEHTRYEPPYMFEDVQISGPFSKWRHTHIVESRDDGALLRDEIDYEPPLSLVGILTAPLLIVPKLERLFAYRHEVTRSWCENPEFN
ncbi:MAG: SRPBCC family protein [Pyrinomonadaceae bacterium]